MKIDFREMREREEKDVEDDAQDVEGDERDQDLSEHRLQIHVLSIENGDRKKIACGEKMKNSRHELL